MDAQPTIQAEARETAARTPVSPPDPVALADAYGLGRPIGLPALAARGELGRIWRVETSTGTWAAKELLHSGDEETARADVAFQDAALGAGIPMPRPVRARDERVLVVVPAHGRQVTVRVYSWIELAGRERRVAAGDAAAILGRLHALAFPDDHSPGPWFSEPVAPDRWQAIEARAAAAAMPWTRTLGALIPELLAGESIIRAARHGPLIRCHLDFNPENVLLDVAGRAVVVDWENSGPAAAEQELASALAEFVPDHAATGAFLDGYEAAGGPATLRDASSFAMTLAFQSNLVAWYAERALDPETGEEDRARSAHWIGDIAANAFTPARIDRWLAAARVGGRHPRSVP